MIVENLRSVQEEIARRKAGRAMGAGDIRLIAVTKNHDISAMRAAIDAGVTDVGENRIQEAIEKRKTLEREVVWHLIGHLQTNKAKQAVANFDLIHSVDSARLLQAIDVEAGKIGKIQDILLQINLAREESKFGFHREELGEALKVAENFVNIRLCGLMCIAPYSEDVEMVRPIFRNMYEIFYSLKENAGPMANIRYLSMGMTNDFGVAIEEGANMVRVGTAIFGERQY